MDFEALNWVNSTTTSCVHGARSLKEKLWTSLKGKTKANGPIANNLDAYGICPNILFGKERKNLTFGDWRMTTWGNPYIQCHC